MLLKRHYKGWRPDERIASARIDHGYDQCRPATSQFIPDLIDGEGVRYRRILLTRVIPRHVGRYEIAFIGFLKTMSSEVEKHNVARRHSAFKSIDCRVHSVPRRVDKRFDVEPDFLNCLVDRVCVVDGTWKTG